MEKLKQTVLDAWLHIDYYYIANKLGFNNYECKISDALIVDTIRCLDYVTVMEKDNVNYAITIIALMWTHINKEKYDIRSVVVKFLSRIGYPTSAIMVDDEYDKNTNKFSFICSPLDKLTITLNQLPNEVTVKNKQFLLTSYQKRIWDSLDGNKIIGISAPTSAGKSFVILLKLISKIVENPCDIIYIIPTLSLVTQVTEDFNKMLKLLNMENYSISNSYVEYGNKDQSHIFIMTQEKANSALSSDRNAFNNRLILVADEIQNIERILNHEDERAKILFDTLTDFRYKENVEQIIISGPRIQQINKVGENIFGIETDDVITEISPVLNLTYSIKQFEGQYFFKQYCMLTENAICEAIMDSKAIVGYGKNKYDDDYFKFLNRIINCFRESQNIVFAPTPDVARNIANHIDCCKSNHQTQDLISYYKNTVRENYSLCDSLSHGAAYHHGRLPMHVRCTLEKAISERLIGTVACTTTLMQGVNMPAQNIIIRNPHLYLARRSSTAELSNYEMANLRGRAGRLLKDFIGRTFVMDESSFEETDGYDQLNLFDDVEKELPSNYGQKFEENKEQILDVLDSDSAINTSMDQYGFLISHIRQSVLKFGDKAKSRLQNVGIKLTKEQLAAIILRMDKLSVPKEICSKNRYWDPVVLDDIFINYKEQVPSHPNERGARAKLDRMLKYLRDNPSTSYMYNKHIKWALRKGSGRSFLLNLCMKWSKEVCLTEILNNNMYDNPDEIDSTIEILQNTVAFHVPILLKPIFDIKKPDSCFLTCMQSGAFNIVTRKLIALGIPRETAIYLNDNLFSRINLTQYDDNQLENYIRNQLKTNIDLLPYWIKVQFEYLI